MSLTLEQQHAVQAAARSYVGTPWRGQGRDHEGIDCTGFIECSFHYGGMPVDIMDPRYQNVDPALLMRRINQFCDRIPNGAPETIGDVVIYGVPHEAHCALLVDGRGFRMAPRPGLNMIHAPLHQKVVESRFDIARGLIRGIYRWRS